MKNIAVFFGGQSVEHDVSIITGALTLNSLDREKYNAIPVYVDRTGKWYTGEKLKDVDEYKNLDYKKLKEVTLKPADNTLYSVKGKRLKPFSTISVAINCMHGERGEDGCLAGLLSMCAIPLASPPLAPSGLCMDKCITKTVMKGLRVKTLPSVTVEGELDFKAVKAKLKYPLIVKPASLGSSIGVQKARTDDELESAVLQAKRYGSKVIIEPLLNNFIEINCGAYMGADGEVRVSECERPMGASAVLSFDDKYKYGKRIFPADIDEALSDKIKSTTRKIYKELYLQGVIRIDYFVCGKEIFLNEVNTVPGSLAFYLFGETLKSFSVMLDEMITLAQKTYNATLSEQRIFKTSILNMSGSKSKNACKY